MSFFDASERGALTLTLSRHDPFNADYLLTPDRIPLYRVRTRKRHLTPEASGITTGFGYLDVEVTSVFRVRSTLTSISSKASRSASTSSHGDGDGDGRRGEKTAIENEVPRAGPRATASCSAGSSTYRRNSSRRGTRTSSILSTPLEPINEVADIDTDTNTNTDPNVNVSFDNGALTSDSPSPDSSSPSDAENDTILVATIERRPLSFSPVRLKFNGSDGPANKFLRRERPFSSTRCFLSITGDLLKWQLSTPTPKLYTSTKTRLAKYSHAFLPNPSKGVLSPRTAVLEIAEGVESDKALDEIIVTLLLTFLL